MTQMSGVGYLLTVLWLIVSFNKKKTNRSGWRGDRGMSRLISDPARNVGVKVSMLMLCLIVIGSLSLVRWHWSLLVQVKSALGSWHATKWKRLHPFQCPTTRGNISDSCYPSLNSILHRLIEPKNVEFIILEMSLVSHLDTSATAGGDVADT
jgi:hypothetical protein